MGRERRSSRRSQAAEEEEEEEEQQDSQTLMPPPPPKPARRASSRASASAAANQEDEEEETEEQWGSDDEQDDDDGDADEEASKGKGKRKRSASSGAGKKPAGQAKKRPSAAAAKDHAAQAGFFCDEEVEVGFSFTQVPFTQSNAGGGGGGKRRASAAAAAASAAASQKDELLCAGSTQVSQDVLLLDHEQRKFDDLPAAQREQAVGAAVRLILFKGSRREPIQKKAINDEVAKAYGKSLVKPILKAAAAKLEDTFGYMLVAPPAHKFPRDKDTFFLVNKLGSGNAALQAQLNSFGRDVGYRGFVMVVLGLVFCAAAAKITERELFTQLETLDPSAVKSLDKPGEAGEKVISGSLEGVGDVGLALERMRREQYLVRDKEPCLRRGGATGEGPAHEFWFKLGPRAYVEVGLRQLLQFLAEAQDQEIDQTMLHEIEAEEKRERDALAAAE